MADGAGRRKFEPLPIAQVRLLEPLSLYAEADTELAVVGRVRWGDVVLIYEQAGEWLKTEEGWLPHGELTLEPAVVQYSLNLTDSLF